jgi:hypothetical protein
LSEWENGDPSKRKEALAVAEQRLRAAGADLVLASVADLPRAIEQIEQAQGRHDLSASDA